MIKLKKSLKIKNKKQVNTSESPKPRLIFQTRNP
jgi:hypothetical protein